MEHIIGKLLCDYEHGRMSRRQLIQTLTLTATAAATVGTAEAAAPANAISINHVSMQVADYTKTRDFYSSLFGMKLKPAVEAELKRRGLNIRATEGSFHVQDPDGFEVHMG